jgi:hypothetical protein
MLIFPALGLRPALARDPRESVLVHFLQVAAAVQPHNLHRGQHLVVGAQPSDPDVALRHVVVARLASRTCRTASWGTSASNFSRSCRSTSSLMERFHSRKIDHSGLSASRSRRCGSFRQTDVSSQNFKAHPDPNGKRFPVTVARPRRGPRRLTVRTRCPSMSSRSNAGNQLTHVWQDNHHLYWLWWRHRHQARARWYHHRARLT